MFDYILLSSHLKVFQLWFFEVKLQKPIVLRSEKAGRVSLYRVTTFTFNTAYLFVLLSSDNWQHGLWSKTCTPRGVDWCVKIYKEIAWSVIEAIPFSEWYETAHLHVNWKNYQWTRLYLYSRTDIYSTCIVTFDVLVALFYTVTQTIQLTYTCCVNPLLG